MKININNITCGFMVEKANRTPASSYSPNLIETSAPVIIKAIKATILPLMMGRKP